MMKLFKRFQERKKEWESIWRKHRKQEDESSIRPESWSDAAPNETEHIAQWETALEGDCAMEWFVMEHGRDDQGMDENRDYTGVDWFSLHPDSNLEKAIELYAQINTYRKACEAHGVCTKNTKNETLNLLMWNRRSNRFLLISPGQFDALGKNTEHCLSLCRKHNLRIGEALPDYRYYDHVSGKTFEVYVASEGYGSVDDAATYGYLELREV